MTRIFREKQELENLIQELSVISTLVPDVIKEKVRLERDYHALLYKETYPKSEHELRKAIERGECYNG